MKRGTLSASISRREDKGVAEIVGAILIFAVVITVFTSFMVWYIPAQTTSNEAHYEHNTKNALGSFVTGIHQGGMTQGYVLSENVPLGISGVAIFSPSQDTEFSLLPQSNSFNATLAFNLTVSATNSTGVPSLHYVNESYTASGIMNTNGNTEYVTSINYVIEDGALFQNYGDNQAPDTLGPMPIGVSSSGAQYGLNLGIYGLSGSSIIYSSSQSQVINLQVNTSKNIQYVNGSAGIFGPSQYVVNGIVLNSLNYTVNGTLVSAWDYGLFSQFNTSSPGYSAVLSMPSWNFTGVPLSAAYYGTGVSITNSGPVNLSSISSEYLVFQGT